MGPVLRFPGARLDAGSGVVPRAARSRKPPEPLTRKACVRCPAVADASIAARLAALARVAAVVQCFAY